MAKPKVKVAQPYDELDAVKDIYSILSHFESKEQERILRWVREKLGIDFVGGHLIVPAAPIVAEPKTAAITRTAPALRNPHLMAKPPLNKIIIQDDDDDGDLVGVPKDADLPEPPEAEILKPVKETRRLITKKFKDGSSAVVMAK